VNTAAADIAPTQTLGKYIRSGRDAAGLTRCQLCAKIGYGVDAVLAWEQDRRTPSPSALHRLVEALPGLDPARLLALAPADGRGRARR
jgi:transcriptional regulator with XRE-family HTH domain